MTLYLYTTILAVMVLLYYLCECVCHLCVHIHTLHADTESVPVML
jgi:hypothetical protein